MRGSPYKSFDTADELRESGMYEIVTPDAAVDLIRERGGVDFKPLMGGLDPDIGWESPAPVRVGRPAAPPLPNEPASTNGV